MALSKQRVAELVDRYVNGEFMGLTEYTEMVIRESDNAGNALFRQCKCTQDQLQTELPL